MVRLPLKPVAPAHRLGALLLTAAALVVGPARAQDDLRAREALAAATVTAGAVAKIICSGVFVSKLPQQMLRADDLAAFPRLPAEVDADAGRVTVRAGPLRRWAEHRNGAGCTLHHGDAAPGSPLSAPKSYPALPEDDPGHPWPLTTSLSEGLSPVLDRAFDATRRPAGRRTRAVLVLHDGKVVAERYAQGIQADTALPGYSMAKGVGNLLVGLLVRRGWAELSAQDLRAEWRARADDPRRTVTLDHLLRMTSGLEWNESYAGTTSDVMVMLTAVPAPGAYAAARPLRRVDGDPVRPGALWHYSSGDYALLADAVAETLARKGHDGLRFPYEELLRPLGMTSAVLETTADGRYFLSSFMLATARDWGRLGLFLLDQATGARRWPDMLPPGWMAESLRETGVPGMRPGTAMVAAFWVRSLGAEVPEDAFFLAGFQGQYLIVVPSRKLVIVRLAADAQEGVAVARELAADVVGAFTAPDSR